MNIHLKSCVENVCPVKYVQAGMNKNSKVCSEECVSDEIF